MAKQSASGGCTDSRDRLLHSVDKGVDSPNAFDEGTELFSPAGTPVSSDQDCTCFVEDPYCQSLNAITVHPARKHNYCPVHGWCWLDWCPHPASSHHTPRFLSHRTRHAETARLIRTGSPGRPPRLSHTSSTLTTSRAGEPVGRRRKIRQSSNMTSHQ